MCCCTPMVFSHESATRKGDARKGDARKGDARKGDARKGDARKGDALVFLFQQLMLVVGLNWLMWVTVNVALAV